MWFTRRLRIRLGPPAVVARGCDVGEFGVGTIDATASGAAVAPGAGRPGDRCRGSARNRCATCRVDRPSSRPGPAGCTLRRLRRRRSSSGPPASGPTGSAQWIAGYWAWDTEQGDFVWVGGSWQIPPAGSIWVAGRWNRDAGGWYWVPGMWSRRGNPAVVAANRPAWRTTGPPADHPEDVPAPAPGADFFFVPGHYAPDGDRLAWIAGFWSRLQPGWDWIPARWVRRPNGWEFREGYWVRDPAAAVVITNPWARRRFAARPALSGQPPVVVQSRPGAVVTDRLPPPPGTVIERDPIAGAEAAGVVVPDDDTDVIIGSVAGAPYYVIRPPGMYPYGPAGVVVPGAVPPFVRRLLDRVLP